MSAHSELDRLLTEAYPEHFQGEPVDPDAEHRQAFVDAEIHAQETRLHRRLIPEEREEVEAFVGRRYQEANEHADRVMGRFGADLEHQAPLLERDLGRKLLSHEVEGLAAVAWHHLQVRGEPLDAEAALQEYWGRRHSETGERPPDMRDEHDIAEHMAARVRDLNAAHAAAEAEAPAAVHDLEAPAREHDERQAEQHLAAATVPMRYRGELEGPRNVPDWSAMSSDEQDAAMAARIAGHEYAERHADD